MYFVDRERIEQLLSFIERQLEIFGEEQTWETPIEKMALERITHTIIEGILDVGNSMIDGFIMRDPGSYADIIDILEDEKVLTKEMAVALKNLIGFRKSLVQEYHIVDHETLLEQFHIEKEALLQFAPRVRDYLEKELGPVNAFKN